jgi:hypothetical protein
MSLNYTDLNWVAVVAAAIGILVVGFVYFLPQVLGSRWAASVGRELPSYGSLPPMTYVAAVITALVAAYVLAVVMDAVGAATLTDGILVGVLAWLGFAATTSYGAVTWEGRSTTWWAITNGNALISFAVAGAILGGLGTM